MESFCVVAIVRPEVREAVEKAVREVDTHGVTVSKVPT
jgi:nitrogen regulatory protein PII